MEDTENVCSHKQLSSFARHTLVGEGVFGGHANNSPDILYTLSYFAQADFMCSSGIGSGNKATALLLARASRAVNVIRIIFIQPNTVVCKFSLTVKTEYNPRTFK